MNSKFQDLGLSFEAPTALKPILFEMPSALMPAATAKPSFMGARPGLLQFNTFDVPTPLNRNQAPAVP